MAQNPGSFAKVILPLALQNTFTYRIPVELRGEVARGKRVIVQFGRKKLYTGLVYSLHENPAGIEHIKDIISVLDHNPLINEYQFRFWEWMADYYMCSFGEIFKAALPAGLKLESESRVQVNPDIDPDTLEAAQKRLYSLAAAGKGTSVNNLLNVKGLSNNHHHLRLLVEKGAFILEERLKKNYRPRKSHFIKLNPEITEKLEEVNSQFGRAYKQQEVFQEIVRRSQLDENLVDTVELSLAELSAEFGHSIINSLVDKSLLVKYSKEVSRIENNFEALRKPYMLNNYQNEALEGIRNYFNEKRVVLLHGVTSSGKTEIYIHLIQEMLQKGKQVLYLLPEIALTSQIVKRLQKVFGEDAGVYHSRFSDAERIEVYNQLANRSSAKLRLVIGVRSAVFLPFDDLGLIIVDEEHENSFKQYDPAPRYHARDSAIVLASIHQANVLLGTATPSIESYANCKSGKYGFEKLDYRYGDILLPEIVLADVRNFRKKRQMKSVFTPVLLDEIQKTLENGKQIILFQNRRGFSSFLECENCSWVPQCKTCDVSLTYHKFEKQMLCHYCGYTESIPHKCPTCHSTALVTRGFGTELVEDTIELIIPGIRVARLDLDSSRSRNRYTRILDEFGSGEIDILVGTQMLSKGLDFENVALVGIMNADQMLNYPDFRAFERSYQLMAQVSGRSGRKNERGKVIIQTMDPGHQIIRQVISNDYEGMFMDQMMERQTFAYPPFVKMIKLTVKSRYSHDAGNAAAILADELRKTFGRRVLGPQVPLISRIKSQYLQQIILKIERKSSFKKARTILSDQLQNLQQRGEFKKVRINIDVDPA